MRYLLILIVLSLTLGSNAQVSGYAVTDILLNTFKLRTKKGSGTAFVTKYENRIYLITARHCFPSTVKHNDWVSFDILYDSVYSRFSGKILYHQDTAIDIAAIDVEHFTPKLQPFPLTHEIAIGQDAMFFGFPYNTFYTKAFGHSLPFVKHAVISAIKDSLFFLDGINNPGFSGGPIVVRDSQGKLCIAGVVTAYHPEYNFIENAKRQKSDSLKYYFNSGIIYAHPRKQIEETLNRND
jgi:hypothetical protein